MELDNKDCEEIIKWAAKKADEAFETILAERHRILFGRISKGIYRLTEKALAFPKT